MILEGFGGIGNDMGHTGKALGTLDLGHLGFWWVRLGNREGGMGIEGVSVLGT